MKFLIKKITSIFIFFTISFVTIYAQMNLLDGIERKFDMNLGKSFPSDVDYPTLEGEIRNLPFSVYVIPGKFEAVVNDHNVIDAIIFDAAKDHRLPRKLKSEGLQLVSSQELSSKVKNATTSDKFKEIAKEMGGEEIHTKKKANQYGMDDKGRLSISFYIDDYLITGYFTKAKKKAMVSAGIFKNHYLSTLKVEESY